MGNHNKEISQNPGPNQAIVQGIVRFLLLFVIMLAVLLLSAGTWRWWEAWAYTIQGLIVILHSRLYIILKRPDMAVERAEAGRREGVQPWDRLLMPLTALLGPLASWIIAGLDHRFGWSPAPSLAIQLIGLMFLFLGGLLGNWAMIANRFFSSQVRIQTDRDHQVVSGGPYRFVRHPGYLGGVISWIAAPFFFGSYWVAVPTVLVIGAMILRTAYEDRFLQENLPGYREYGRSVRFRLLPGIW